MRRVAAGVGAALGYIVACSPPVEPSAGARDTPAGGVIVETARSRYGTADDVVLTIRNGTSAAVRYSVCPGTLERRDGETWLRSEQLMLCSDDAELLERGSVRMQLVRLPEGVERGEHRIVVYLFAPEESSGRPVAGEALSNTFVVE